MKLFTLISILSVIIFFTSCSHFNQEKEVSLIDSLLLVVDDSLNNNSELSYKLIKDAEKLVNDSLSYCTVIAYFTQYFCVTNQFDSADIYRMKLKKYLPTIKADMSYDKLVMNYNIFSGVIFSNTAQFDSAVYYFNLAYIIARKNKYNFFIPDICVNLADALVRKGDYVLGIHYYREALKVTDSLKLSTALKFPIYLGLGQSYYMGLMNYDLADIYFVEAERVVDSVTVNDKFRLYNNRGNYYYYNKDYQNALSSFLKAKNIAEPLHSDYYINLCYANMSDVYLHLNKLDSAKYFCDTSYKFFTQINIPDFTSYLAIVRGGIALKERDYTFAKRMIGEYQDNDYQDAMLLTLRYQLLEDYNIKTNNYKNAYKYLSKKVILNDSLRSGAIQNAIAETDMRYRQDTAIIRQDYEIKEKDSKIRELTVSSITGIILLVVSIVAFVFIMISRKRKHELQRIKQTDALTKLRMQNIRNRISPHFLFNALNREVSLKTDTKERNELLSLVNMLKRSLILADSVSVSLTDELDFVKEYIEIEKKSFDSDFQCEISVNDNIDTSNVKVLAMIIQIPVENAIKHALRTKQGLKTLSISVIGDQEKTVIKITDNGMGYKPEMHTKSKGTGTGLKVIYQTIAVLNNNNRQKVEFNIKNIIDQNLTGTEVSITIPLKYNFEI